jgi:hypothetical protein
VRGGISFKKLAAALVRGGISFKKLAAALVQGGISSEKSAAAPVRGGISPRKSAAAPVRHNFVRWWAGTAFFHVVRCFITMQIGECGNQCQRGFPRIFMKQPKKTSWW